MIDVLIVVGGLWLTAFALTAVGFAVAFFFGAPISAYLHKRREARTARTIAAFEGCGVLVVRAPYPMERITRLDPVAPPAAVVVPAPRRPINGAPR